jgi:SAM-dependent methyltransferase/acyl carrier protein
LQVGQNYRLVDIAEHLRVVPHYRCMLVALLAGLQGIDFQVDTDTLCVLRSTPDVGYWQDQIRTLAPDHAPLLALLDHCARQHESVLSGQLPGTAVVASDAGKRLFIQAAGLIGRYSSRPHCVRMTCQWVSEWAQASPQPLRILEVGGGTGALTQQLLAVLEGLPVSYCFTDLGTSFLHDARTQAQRLGLQGFEVRKLDLRLPPQAQGFEAESFDLILGLDVVHVTPNLAHTLSHLKSLLRAGGMLCLLESVQVQPWTHAIWGLESGWWDVNDPWRPDAHTRGPLATLNQWNVALETAGLTTVTARQGTSNQNFDTAWLLASKGSPAAMLDSLAAQAQQLANSRLADLQITQARCHELGAQLRLCTSRDWTEQDKNSVAGVVDLAKAPQNCALPANSYQLMLSPPGDVQGAAMHLALAYQRPGAMAWFGVRQVQPDALERVLAAGLPQVVGHTASPHQQWQPPATVASSAITGNDAFGAVQSVWQELLGVAQPKHDDNWYSLGGDSLLTTRVISLLEQRCQVTLSLSDFFNATTLADMVTALEDAQQQTAAQLLSEIEALSDAQLDEALGHSI